MKTERLFKSRFFRVAGCCLSLLGIFPAADLWPEELLTEAEQLKRRQELTERFAFLSNSLKELPQMPDIQSFPQPPEMKSKTIELPPRLPVRIKQKSSGK